MTWIAPDVERSDAPRVADDRLALDAWLDYQRATLLMKCAGLTEQQLRERAVPPSNLSLLGLVRHMADVERAWFQQRFAGRDVPSLYWSDDDWDGEFNNVDTASASDDFATFEREVATSRDTARGQSLDNTFTRVREGEEYTFDLRWVMVHMIEEYARHNGHADLLRERIDGVTGD